MKNNLVSVSGKIGSGKDTLAHMINYIVWGQGFIKNSKEKELWIKNYDHDFFSYEGYEEYLRVVETGEEPPMNETFKVKKFADKLKDIACLLLNCTREELEDREFKEKELGEEWDKWEIKEFWTNDNGSEYVDTVYFESKQEMEYYIDDWGHTEETYEETGLIKMTPRLLLQLLGTECGRNILHPNIWVNSLFNEYKVQKDRTCLNCWKDFNLEEAFYPNPLNKKDFQCPNCKSYRNAATLVENPSNWIITDTRFPNELKAVKDKGGLTIRIKRSTSDESIHASESHIDRMADFDVEIDNNGTMADLFESAQYIVRKFISNESRNNT